MVKGYTNWEGDTLSALLLGLVEFSKPAGVDHSAEFQTKRSSRGSVGLFLVLLILTDRVRWVSLLHRTFRAIYSNMMFVLRSNPPVTQYTFPKDAGAAARENICRAPGPGQYNLPTGVGKQVCCRYT